MVAAGIVSDPDWRQITKALKSAGVLADVTLYTNGKAHPGTGWASELNYEIFMLKMSRHEIVVPCPEALPAVKETVPV